MSMKPTHTHMIRAEYKPQQRNCGTSVCPKFRLRCTRHINPLPRTNAMNQRNAWHVVSQNDSNQEPCNCSRFLQGIQDVF